MKPSVKSSLTLSVFLFFLFSLGLFSGCDLFNPMKGARAYSYIITDADTDSIIEAAGETLKKMEYELSPRTSQQTSLQAYYTYPMVGTAPLLVKVTITNQGDVRKVNCGVFQDKRGKESPDVIGYFPAQVNETLEGMTKLLIKRGYRAQKPF